MISAADKALLPEIDLRLIPEFHPAVPQHVVEAVRGQRVDLIQITYGSRLQTSQENVFDKKESIDEFFRLRLMFAMRHQIEILMHLHPGRDLARDDIRFVNRQPGSGTRMLLDLALRQIGVDPTTINGYATAELTHSAIAAFVASGMADLGFGVQPAAQQFALDFIPVIDEDYLFACDRDKLDDARLGGVLEILRSDAFRDSVAHLEGYDPVFCGQLLELESALSGATGNER